MPPSLATNTIWICEGLGMQIAMQIQIFAERI
jgi:hypothetical protein